MKIWYGYGTEHSANLVIIGTFKTVEDARKTKTFIETLSRLALDDERAGIMEAGTKNGRLSDNLRNYITNNNFCLGYGDLEQLLYDYDIEEDGNRLIVTTEESEFQTFLNIMALHGEAKVELYSAHNYPSQYGRQTYRN